MNPTSDERLEELAVPNLYRRCVHCRRFYIPTWNTRGLCHTCVETRVPPPAAKSPWDTKEAGNRG